MSGFTAGTIPDRGTLWPTCLLITLAILMTPARATPSLASELVPQRKPI